MTLLNKYEIGIQIAQPICFLNRGSELVKNGIAKIER